MAASGLDKDLQGYNLATHILASHPHPEEDVGDLKRFDISIPIAGFGSVIATTFRITIPCSFAYRITGWRLHSTMNGACSFTVAREGSGTMFTASISANGSDATGSTSQDMVADSVLDIDLVTLTLFTNITLTLECEKALTG
jgi:hypothetical protein